jgi:hypothetical protein
VEDRRELGYLRLVEVQLVREEPQRTAHAEVATAEVLAIAARAAPTEWPSVPTSAFAARGATVSVPPKHSRMHVVNLLAEAIRSQRALPSEAKCLARARA